MRRMTFTWLFLASILGVLACRTTPPSGGSSGIKDTADASPPTTSMPAVQTRDQQPVPVAHLSDGIPPTPVCDASQPLALNAECKSPDEDALNGKITAAAVGFQSFQNPKPDAAHPGTDPLSKRDFHPKSTACVAAFFDVLPGLAADLRQGVFAAGGAASGFKYRAVIRYSNGSPAIKADGTLGINKDGEPDARAMAVKLVGVSGTPLLSTAPTSPGTATQDFMLTDFPVFFLRNINSAIKFFPGLLNGTAAANLDPHELANLVGGRKVIADIFNETYWSQGPYRFGAAAAKYQVRPVACDAPLLGRAPGATETDFLRQNASDRLATGSVCFDFFVQRQSDAVATPVEDTTIEWLEADAPPVKIARITIPKGQDVLSAERQQFCENLSFSPWNGIVEHRPLGSINRIRLTAYSGISTKRRMENQVPIGEPTGNEDFFSVLTQN